MVKIIIIMSDNREIEENQNYWSCCAYINKQYCDKFNYEFLYLQPYYKNHTQSINTCVDINTGSLRHSSWSKLIMVQYILKNYECDYVVYIDSDCVFKNFNISIEYIIDKYKNSLIFHSSAPWHPHLPCAGFFICKNTDDNINFLNMWYTYKIPDNHSIEWKNVQNMAKISNEYQWLPNKHWEQDILWTLIANNKYVATFIDEISLFESKDQFLRHVCSTNSNSQRNSYFRNMVNYLTIQTNKDFITIINTIKKQKVDTSLFYNYK
jgi:hypothetical protein